MIAGAGEGGSHRGAVNLMQDGIESRAFPVAGDKGPDSGLFCFALRGRSDQRPLNDSRMKVSSASTIPLNVRARGETDAANGRPSSE